MPELPDVTLYVERLEALFKGEKLEGIRLKSPFLVRSYDPPLYSTIGKRLLRTSRIGKRIVFGFEGDLFWVLHLMIAGRLRCREKGAPLPGKLGLLGLDFENKTLLLTEAGTKKRASLHLVIGAPNLAQFDRGGLEPLSATALQFRKALLKENRTLKRALTDPTIFSGIGNAYSDEILFEARLSPVTWTTRLESSEIRGLHRACKTVMRRFITRLRAEVGDGFPEQVTAFREDMSVHGRYKKPCPRCATPVQRVVYAQNELNYCPTCQTGGKLLADRALSRLLKGDWPKSLEELEERKERAKSRP